MIERIFLGRQQPALLAAADALQQQYARADRWDMSSLVIALPGRQAGRRLRQILTRRASEARLRLRLPEMITPASLPERWYAPTAPLASSLEALLAWMRAARALTPEDRQALPGGDNPGGHALSGLDLARRVARLRAELMAEGLSFADAASRGVETETSMGDCRPALARLETRYQAELAQAGRVDRDDARREAFRRGRLACAATLVLVGLADLGRQDRESLRALTTPVIAFVAAPDSEQAGFDDVGCLVADFWQGRPWPIDDERLHFPEDFAAQAQALHSQIMAVRQNEPRQAVTIGLGDERDAEGIARRLRIGGVLVRSPFGRPLARTRPGVLLSSARDFLAQPSPRAFAALLRHPDLEARLAEARPPQAEETPPPTSDLLTALDLFLDRRMPGKLPPALPEPLESARQALETLLLPLHAVCLLSEWPARLTAFLDAVFGEPPTEDADQEEAELRRARKQVDIVLAAFTEAHPRLAPRLSGAEALSFALNRMSGVRLPEEEMPGAVEMMGWLELALDDAPTLLLTGLHEGAVPAAASPDGLLPDSLRQTLGLPDIGRRQARDAFLLRVMVETRPHACVFAARRGADGAARRPSRLLFQCDGETAARRVLRFTEDAGLSSGDSAGPLFAPGAARRLSPPRPEPLLTPLTLLRVTAFRDYLTCPYRFYLRHALQLRDCDDGAEEMDAGRFGDLLHDCLAAFARSAAAHSLTETFIRDFLRADLDRQARRQFGADWPPALRFQVRQAGRRLGEFARWQAAQTADGWLIQTELTERELRLEWMVDDQPVTISGRIDRVDYHPATERFRLVDYKTGSAAKPPDRAHRGPAGDDGRRPWLDLQLPLYRRLAAAEGIPLEQIELGYVLLPAELAGTGYQAADWTDADLADADACAETVMRQVRQEVFWPPSPPGRYPDGLTGLCLDRCRDREEWFLHETSGEAAP